MAVVAEAAAGVRLMALMALVVVLVVKSILLDLEVLQMRSGEPWAQTTTEVPASLLVSVNLISVDH